MTHNEIWKPVKGYEGLYEVSNLGRIYSLISNKILSPSLDTYGYPILSLCKDGIKKTKTVHKLVIKSFVLNPENKSQVNHKNGIKTDNRVENLEWCTMSENIRHAYDTGLQKGLSGEDNPSWGKHGSQNGNHKLTEEEVLKIRELYSTGLYTQKLLGEMFNTAQLNISFIVRRKTWRHI